MNNNNNNNQNVNNNLTTKSSPELSPYVVSLRSGQPVTPIRSANKSRVTRNHLLPPIAGDARRSGKSRSSKSRSHTHRSVKSSSRHGTAIKRSHSASHNSTPIDSIPSSPVRKHRQGGHAHTASVHRGMISSPEKSVRSRQINKIETVRILRARPLFYPVIKDKPCATTPSLLPPHSSTSRSRTSRSNSATISPHLIGLELPENLITTSKPLHAGRPEAKRKRRGIKTLSSSSTSKSDSAAITL